MLYWKAYVQAVLGIEVLDAQEKFNALNEKERAGWEAVAALSAAGTASKAK